MSHLLNMGVSRNQLMPGLRSHPVGNYYPFGRAIVSKSTHCKTLLGQRRDAGLKRTGLCLIMRSHKL